MSYVQSRVIQTTPEGCFIVKIGGRMSLNSKGYVQIAVKTPYNPNDQTSPDKKVQLHQLMAWNTSRSFQYNIASGVGEVSHLCHNKLCCNGKHLTYEGVAYNKSRNNCPVVIAINEVYVSCCKHEPRCIASPLKKLEAIQYTVITKQDGEIVLVDHD